MSDPRILERNVAALLARAYVPVRPSPAFRRRLHAEFLAEWEAAVRRRRDRRSPSPLPRVAAAVLATAAAVLLWTVLGPGAGPDDPRPASLDTLLAGGDVAVRRAPGANFEAALPPLVHGGGYLEVVTPLATGAEVRAAEDVLTAAGESRVVVADGPRARLERGAVALDVGTPWELGAAPGRVALDAGRLFARLEGADLVLRLDAGSAAALTPDGRAPLPRGESRLRGGRLVPGLAAVAREDGVREAAPALPEDADPSADPAAPEDPSADAPTETGPAGGATLVGTVLDPDGRPVDAFEVRLLVEQDYANVTDPLRRSFAGADGRLEWSGIEPGRYDVFVSADGLAHWKRDARVALEADATTSVDVRLEPGATVRGLVLDRESGLAVEGALVVSEADVPLMALPLADSDALAQLGHGTRTRADGSFELGRLGSGTQVLRVSAPGHAPRWSEHFELVAGELLDGLVFELGPEARVSGRVHGDDGHPQPGVTLVAALVDGSGRRLCMSFAQDVTDEDGEYRMGGLPEEFGVVVHLGVDFAAPPEIQPVMLVEGEEQRVDFGDDDAGTRLVGTVRHADGEVAAQLPISIAPEGQANSFDGWRAGSTDAEGHFAFDDLDAGRWDFFVSYGMSGSVTLIASFEVPDWPEFEQEVVVPAGALRGRIERAEDGSPVLFSAVVLERKDGPGGPVERFVAKAMSDAEGRYELSHLSPGTYRATAYATADALSSAVAELELTEAGASSSQDFVLERGTWPTLFVLDPAGTPVAGARVSVRDAATGADVLWLQNPTTGVDGRLKLSPFRPGPVRLEVRAEGYEPYVAEAVPSLGEPTLSVTLRPIADDPGLPRDPSQR